MTSRVDRLGHRLRAVRDGRVVVDTLDAVVVTAPGELPQYAVPPADVDGSFLRGTAGTVPTDAVDAAHAADRVAIPWAAADRWYAEDDEVVGHARDPHHRVDALRSSRLVEVRLGGELVARSGGHTVVLLETDRPNRWFLPRVDVNADLRRSGTVSASPYLGVATHWTAPIDGDRVDVAVSYRAPLPAVALLENLISFDPDVAEVAPITNGGGDGRG